MSYYASIIVPILNERDQLEQALARLAIYRQQGWQLIVVDGGSYDGSEELAKPYADIVISAKRGRAKQMNAGAALADSPWLFFLHIDTVLPDQPQSIVDLLPKKNTQVDHHSQAVWGYFTLRLSGLSKVFRLIEWFINKRSFISKIPTGDQVMFFNKTLFDTYDGFADIALMEDVDIAKRLRRKITPKRLPLLVFTSSRRWEEQGVIKTVVKMWVLRFLFWLGVSPNRFAAWYRS